jgi:hypothetical protein
MHLEIPASEPLETLDYFLRDTWLECCGHLSAFKIGDTEYSSEPEDFYFGEAPVEEEEESEEDESDEEADIDELLSTFPPEFVKVIPPDLIAELKNAESSDDIVTFLKEQLKSLPKGGFPHTPEEMDEYRTRYFQRTLMESLLDMLEDRSLEVPLEKVLKVGQKFSHEYDFGSTTHLNLRVISEREGIVGDEEDPVEILARNVPPPILCRVCGKPATKVASGYYDAEENGYCNKCARKSEDADMMLPVVNSPRVGVCGYTG